MKLFQIRGSFSLRKFVNLKILYLSSLIFYIFTKTLPFTNSYLGFQYLLGGDFSFVGIIFLFSSLRQVYRRNNYKASIYGIIGCIICLFFQGFILNLLEKFTAMWLYGYYLSIIGIIIIMVMNIGIMIDYFAFFNLEKEARIKRVILNYGTLFPRLKLREISEITKLDQNYVVSTVRKMIKNQEIHAKIYKSSKSILFNQLANLEQIDMLLNQYENWEEKNIGKI